MPDEKDRQSGVRNSWLLLCIPFEILIGVGVALATFQLLLELIRLWIGTELFGGYIFGLGALILSGAVGLGFAVFALTRRNPKYRLTVDIAGIVFWIVAFVIPMQYRGYTQQAEEQARAEKAVMEGQAYQIKFNAWLENMKKTGQHGPPGVVPPMLSVQDQGTTVKVMNILDKEIVITLARVRQDPTAPGGWKGCGMYTDSPPGMGGGRFYHYTLSPKDHLTFSTHENCASAFLETPIEYRVGRRAGDIGWWSNSAFAKPEGREYEGIR
jgi:hypothetical protein